MDNALKGLFGSGGEDEVVATDRAKDFVRRYSEGPKDQGYEASEAADQLNRLLPKASADQVQRATRQALQDLPEDQRSQFGDFVKQVRQRDPGSREMADGGGFGMDDIAGMFGQAGGSANSIDDLFGGVLGGGGSGGGLGNILGGLLGGGADTNTRATQQDEGGGIGDFLGSGVGKVVLGGIAAYLTKEMLDDR